MLLNNAWFIVTYNQLSCQGSPRAVYERPPLWTNSPFPTGWLIYPTMTEEAWALILFLFVCGTEQRHWASSSVASAWAHALDMAILTLLREDQAEEPRAAAASPLLSVNHYLWPQNRSRAGYSDMPPTQDAAAAGVHTRPASSFSDFRCRYRLE